MKKPQSKENGMNCQQIMDYIEKLGHAQGFYIRLHANLKTMERDDPDTFNRTMKELEARNFHDPVDLVMYLEC